jgi:hypothetical protein
MRSIAMDEIGPPVPGQRLGAWPLECGMRKQVLLPCGSIAKGRAKSTVMPAQQEGVSHMTCQQI